MLIIPYVCADFRDKKGNPIFRITADMLVLPLFTIMAKASQSSSVFR